MSRQGIVKFFNPDKGFGFITPTDNGGANAQNAQQGANGAAPGGAQDDLFVHFSGINAGGYKSLNDGETVCFDEYWDETKGKSSAVNVTGNGDGVPRKGAGKGGKGGPQGGFGGPMMGGPMGGPMMGGFQQWAPQQFGGFPGGKGQW